MKAAKQCHARLLGGAPDNPHPALKNLTDAELAACCAIIDGAWEEAQKDKDFLRTNEHFAGTARIMPNGGVDIVADAPKYDVAKVERLVAAAMELRARHENTQANRGKDFFCDELCYEEIVGAVVAVCGAVADLEKK